MFGQQINSIKSILKSTEPADCFKLQFKALKMLNVFQDASTNIFFKCLSFFLGFLVVKLYVMSTIFLISKDVALEEKIQGSFTSNASLLCVVKMYYFRKHQHKVEELVKNLKSRVNDMNEEETKILSKEAIYPTIISYLALLCLLVFSCTVYGCFPVGKNNYGKPMPVYSWYPKYFSEGIPYKVVYALQEISINCAAIAWVSVDVINFGLLAHQNAMFKILGRRIASLGWTEKEKGSKHDNDYNYKKLCECVKYHIEISSYASESGQIYSSILFIKTCFSVVIICSFVYTLCLVTTNYGGFVAQLGILSVIVITLFLVSWIGEQITATSDELLNKAAECNFQNMDRRTTKALILFMQGAITTVYIEVGSIMKIRLSLKVFVQIIDFAYKCLALLKTAAVN